MKRTDLTYRLTKVGGKVASVAVCALTGAVMFGVSGAALAVPVVYYQTIADGRTYFDNTVNTYAQGGTPNLVATTLSGLSTGTSWNANGITITSSDGGSRTVNDTYLAGAPSLTSAGLTTGQGVDMSVPASGSLPDSGLTFAFGSQLNAFGIELGDWGTCCYASSLYIQFGNNGVWDAEQKIGTANSKNDVPEHPGQTFTFIGAINDTNFFNQVRIWGDGRNEYLTAGGTLRSASVELNSVPANAGSSTQQPAATDIDTAQSYYQSSKLGSTVNPAFEGGTLQIDSATPTITQDFTVANSGGTIDANGNSATFSGVIADKSGGHGSLTLTGAGTTTFSGVNTYSGSTTINSGATLALSEAGDISESSGVANNGSFDIAATNNGATIKSLSGDGVVALGDKTLTLSQAGGNFAGGIHGAGGLAVSGGTQILSGSSDYTGGTTISGGATVKVAADSALGAANGGLTLNDGTLATTATHTSARNIALAGNGTFDVADATTLTKNGHISGSGNLTKEGEGTLVLCGSDYTGTTTVSAGTLKACKAGALSAASATTLVAGATLDLNNYDQTIGSLAGAGDVTLGSAKLTTGGDSSDTTFSGDIAGSGGLTKTGSGTLTLSGDSGYRGATTVSGGTLKAGKAGALSSDSAITVASGATLDLNGFDQTVGSLAGAGHVTLGSANLNTGGDNGSTAFSGDIAGTGGLAKTGSGTLTLSGANTYSGGTAINGGAVQVASDSALGAASGGLSLNGGALKTSASFTTVRAVTLAGSGTLDTAADTSLTSSGIVSGNGPLIKNGAGTLTLEGSNSYQGGTVVNEGVLAVAADAALGAASGNITLNSGTLQTTASMGTDRRITLSADSTLLTDAGTTFTQNGGIDGSGRLFKNGTGTLVLSGTNTYSGGTTINGGIVDVADGSSLGTGTVLLNGGTLHTTATLAANQQVLVSGNSQARVDAGTTALLSGTISDGGSSGCFDKTGSGKLNMTGSATLNNGTCVQEGMLSANGTLNSWVQVYTAGTLRGTGHINGDITVRGTLAPGNSPGLMTQTGTTTMAAGSTFQEDIDGTTIGNGAGHYSHLEITGGQFIIGNNVTLAPVLRGITGSATNTFTPSLGELFRIITADGGVVGRFDTLTQPASGLAPNTRFTAFYNMRGSNSVDLALTPASYASYLGRGNVNARSAGSVLDKLLAHQDDGSASSRQSGLLYAVAGVNGSNLPALATTLAGEVHGAMAAAAPQAGRMLQDEVAGHLGSVAAGGGNPDGSQDLWVNVSNARNRVDGDGYASSFHTSRDQFTVGRDLLGNGRSRVGVGFSHADTHVTANAGTGSVEDNFAFVYGQHGVGSYLVDGMAGYGLTRWETQRADPLQQTGSLKTAANGHEALIGAGVRLPLQYRTLILEPFARALWQQSSRKGIDESSASDAGLAFQGYRANGARVLAGLAGGSLDKDPLATPLTYQFNIALGVDIGDEGHPQVQGSLAGENLTVVTPHSSRDFVRALLSGTVRLNRLSYAYLGLNGEVGKGRSEFGATAGVRIRF